MRAILDSKFASERETAATHGMQAYGPEVSAVVSFGVASRRMPRSGRTDRAQRVVGVGLSSGGLEPLRQMLAVLPSNAGLSLVVLQQPTTPAQKAGKLAAALRTGGTELDVVEAVDGHRVAPNTVVVVPPRTTASLARGALVLRVAKRSRKPIDSLFGSLASALKERAIGVVLAGTVDDGGAGLDAIRKAGGITILEENQSPKQIGKRLAAIVTDPRTPAQSDSQTSDNTLLASIDIAIIVVDSERRVRSFTPKARAIMNLSPADIGRPIGEIETPLRIRELDGTITMVIDTRGAHDSDVHAVDRSSTYRMQIRPVAGGGAVLTFIDISALRTSVDADLRLAADRQRDAFLTSLSDELRTPLSAILLWTDVLRGLDKDDPHRDVAIDTIAECARAEARLVDDLLDLAMSASGELALEAHPIEAEPIVREAIESILPCATERRINLIATLDSNDSYILSDPRRLQQVVKKLLANAVEFTAEGSDILISLRQIGRSLELRIRDRGPGIDADFLPRVFEPFAQQDPSSARVHRGLGIGLALVRYLVERQAGTIDVESSNGEGSTFVVRFPVTTARA